MKVLKNLVVPQDKMSLTVENLYKNIHDVSLHTFFYMAFDDGQDLTYLGGYWTVLLRCSCLNSASQQLKLSHKRQMSKWRVDDVPPNDPTGSKRTGQNGRLSVDTHMSQ